MKSEVFTVGSARDVEALLTVAVGTAPCEVRINGVDRIADAPRMVKLLREVRVKVAPRVPTFHIDRFGKLKTLSRISQKLDEVTTTVHGLIVDPANRDAYNNLNVISGRICGAADYVPRPGRRSITRVGNRIQRVAKKGNKTGGKGMAHRLQALLPLIADLQSLPIRVAPKEPQPAPAPEEPQPAPAPQEPQPAPAPEEPQPAPAPEEPQPAPAP